MWVAARDAVRQQRASSADNARAQLGGATEPFRGDSANATPSTSATSSTGGKLTRAAAAAARAAVGAKGNALARAVERMGGRYSLGAEPVSDATRAAAEWLGPNSTPHRSAPCCGAVPIISPSHAEAAVPQVPAAAAAAAAATVSSAERGDAAAGLQNNGGPPQPSCRPVGNEGVRSSSGSSGSARGSVHGSGDSGSSNGRRSSGGSSAGGGVPGVPRQAQGTGEQPAPLSMFMREASHQVSL